MKQVKEFAKSFFVSLIILSFLALMCFTSIEKNILSSIYFINFKNNTEFIIRITTKFIPWLIIAYGIIIISYKLLKEKWKLKIDKLSLSGATIMFNNPEEIFSQKVQNFLNTKRTLFKIDRKKDNFYETLNSYYKVYEFLREEIKIFDSKSSKGNKKYELANEAIEKLNTFLTRYQNDFRRWYEYTLEKDRDKNYNKDIFHIQKKYRHYHCMVSGFKNVNTFFVYEIAENFKINIKKWDI